MLLTLKNWFSNNNQDCQQDITVEQATAVLLFEAATADYELDSKEEQVLKQALQRGTSITAAEADDLFAWAKQHCLQSSSLYPFTRVLNQQLSSAQKIELLQNLWQVAFADGELDKYEEHYLRHIADLLHLAHSEFISAKLKAQAAIAK